MPALTKAQRGKLREEQVQCRRRAAEIAVILNPRQESEVVAYLRNCRGPVKGSEIAEKLGRRQAGVVTALTRAIAAGQATRVGVGVYQWVPQ